MDTMIAAREHPAVRAWNALVADAAAPTNIVVLREREKSAVYRLAGLGAGGTSVVAKHCRTATGRVEREVYESILPTLPVSALRCYGHVEEEDGSCWLFLEHATGDRFTPALEEHRALAAHWLALLHVAAAATAAAAALPDRGSAHHLAQLGGARADIEHALDELPMTTAERALLVDVATQCERLRAHWSTVETWCAEMPRTLVHGDFRPKNVFVRVGANGSEILALDWETAGWGVPAADVASLRGAPGEPVVLERYAGIARARWPELSLASLRRTIEVGKLFRRIAAIAWCAASLARRWERSIEAMSVHRAELGALLEGARW